MAQRRRSDPQSGSCAPEASEDRATPDAGQDLDRRGMVSQADMGQRDPNPERENINPNQPVVPEKPI